MVHDPQPFGGLVVHRGTNEGLEQRPVQAQVDLGHPPRRREAALVLGRRLHDGPHVVQGARLEAHYPVPRDQIGVHGLGGARRHDGFIQAGRQDVDQVDVGGELLVLLLRHTARYKDPQVANALVHGVDDGLAAGADVVILTVQVHDPAQRLLRRGDVVALGTEADDGRADVAQVDAVAGRRDDLARGQTVADEQLVDDPLDLFAVEVHVAAPPLFEFQEALGLGVHLGPEVVVLGPPGVGRVLVFEVLHQVPAVELAIAQVAGQRGDPAAAAEAAGVAHRVLPLDAGPVGQRRARNDDGAEQVGPDGGDQQHRPAGLAVPDHAGLALGPGVQFDHLLQERDLGVDDVFDRLPRHGVGGEADEIAGMAGAHGHADLAVGLEAADAGAVPRARIDHDKGPLQRIDHHAGRWLDPDQQVVDRFDESTRVQHQFSVEAEHMRHRLGFLRVVLLAALSQHIPEQDGALRCIGCVVAKRAPGLHPGIHAGPRGNGRRRARPITCRFAGNGVGGGLGHALGLPFGERAIGHHQQTAQGALEA